MPIKRIYHPYWKWECYINGMWSAPEKKLQHKKIQDAIEFTSNHILYGEAMLRVVHCWNFSMENFLTNPSVNHRAHIGHCACCLQLGLEESVVRHAWKHLTDTQRALANLEAEKAKNKWIKLHANKNKGIHNEVGKSLLF